MHIIDIFNSMFGELGSISHSRTKTYIFEHQQIQTHTYTVLHVPLFDVTVTVINYNYYRHGTAIDLCRTG